MTTLENITEDLEKLLHDKAAEKDHYTLLMDLVRRVGDLEQRIRTIEKQALEKELADAARFKSIENHYALNPGPYITAELTRLQGYLHNTKIFWIIKADVHPILYRLLRETDCVPTGHVKFLLNNGNILVALNGHAQVLLGLGHVNLPACPPRIK